MLKRIFLYLYSIINYYIIFRGRESNNNKIKLTRYIDTNFAKDSATRYLIGAYVFTLNRGPIS